MTNEEKKAQQAAIDEAVAKALEEASQKAADDKAQALELAKADADAEREKAVEAAKAGAEADAQAAIRKAREQDRLDREEAERAEEQRAEQARYDNRTRHFVLVATSFIGGSLLAPGSRVTDADLGTYVDPADGRTKAVKPGETLVEVNEDGSPIDQAGAYKLQAIAGDTTGYQVAAVAPFSPNPTRPQGAPTQTAGGVSLVEGQLRTLPPEGVESNAAADARSQQAENAARSVDAMTAGVEPRRRGSTTG